MDLLPKHKYETWMWVLLLGIAWLAGTGLSVWDQDESAYAAFAWQMRESGNWLVPEFLWSEIHRKTPFHFWSIAVSYALWGVNEFAVRFPAFLASVGTVLLLRYRAVAVFGKPTAQAAAWVLAANLFLPHLIKISVTDASLLFFETLAVLSLIRFFQQPRSQEQLYFVIGTAGGLLVKGPPVLILSIGMLGLILLFSPERKKIIAFHPWLLFPLAALPLLAWGRMAWQTDDGAFIRWMIDWYTVSRVNNEVLGQTGPPGYYLATILIAFLPFVPLLPKAFQQLFSRYSWRHPQFKQFMLIAWLISGWLIYELLKSKLPAYALGAYPALALLLGQQISLLPTYNFRRQNWLRAGLLLYLLLCLALGLGLPFAAAAPVGDGFLFDNFGINMARFTGIGFLFLGIMTAVFLLRAQYELAFRSMLAQSIFFLGMGWLVLMPGIEKLRGATKEVASFLAANHPEKTLLLSRNFHLPSLPFYLSTQAISYEEATDASRWQQQLAHPEALLLLNSSNFGDFQSAVSQAQFDYHIVYEQAGWISDKGQLTTWYVVQAGRPTTETESAAE
ncbi:MAG: glycosyltransferase family 39 protein [Sphingobacteriaceae bacterium]|nr:glycosyltransferase family 39 protein [Sphingobacteriaceae bacterium]